MPSAPTAIFCSLVIGTTVAACAYAPIENLEADELEAAEPEPTFADDDADDAEEADDDDAADDALESNQGAVRVQDAAPAVATRDAGSADASTATKADAGAESKPDASATKDAQVASDAARDSGEPAAACSAGRYSGAFTGEVTGGSARTSIEGTLTLTLTGSGNTLTIQSGTLQGKDKDGYAIAATVSGKLNCTSGKIESGTLRDGEYRRKVGVVSVVRFDGSVDGTYRAAEKELALSFRFESSLGTREGTGTASARLQ